MKIIGFETKSANLYRYTCPMCGAILEFDSRDIHTSSKPPHSYNDTVVFNCPSCHNDCFVRIRVLDSLKVGEIKYQGNEIVDIKSD